MTHDTGQFIWIPAGGNFDNAVGANCHVYQYAPPDHDQKITLVVDAGLKFLKSADGATLQSLAPDIEDILTDPKASQTTLILTHCHNDHIGAIPHWIKQGHPVPPIMATNFTLHILQSMLAREDIPPNDWPEMSSIEAGRVYDFGHGVRMGCAPASHSVPGALSLLIATPAGNHFHSGDVKADQSVMLSDVTDFELLADWGSQNTIHTALIDCAFVASEGYARTEADVRKDILAITRAHPDKRVLFAGSGSYAETLGAFALTAVDTERVLVYEGSSFETNLLALQKNDQHLPHVIESITGKSLLMLAADNPLAKALRPDQVLALVSGSDGIPSGSVMKAATGKSSWWQPSDQDVFVTPSGMSPAITDMEQKLVDQGVQIIRFTNGFRDICEGHARRCDLRDYLHILNPQTFIPTHGFADATAAALELAREEGIHAQTAFVGHVYQLGQGGLKKIDTRLDQWLHIGAPNADQTQKYVRKYGLG